MGMRYRFARMDKVVYARMLVVRLDNIIIDGKKIHANVPRYDRNSGSGLPGVRRFRETGKCAEGNFRDNVGAHKTDGGNGNNSGVRNGNNSVVFRVFSCSWPILWAHFFAQTSILPTNLVWTSRGSWLEFHPRQF